MMAAESGVAVASSLTGAVPVKNVEPSGLSSDEAKVRLEKDGPNAMPDTPSSTP